MLGIKVKSENYILIKNMFSKPYDLLENLNNMIYNVRQFSLKRSLFNRKCWQKLIRASLNPFNIPNLKEIIT